MNKINNENTQTNMSEVGQTLYATFIPLVIILLILGGAGYFLLGGEFKLPKFYRDQTEIRRLEGYPTIVENDSLEDRVKEVITSQEELNEFLNLVDPNGKLGVVEDIDFDKEYLIGAATKTNPTYGYELKIRKVYLDKEDNSLLISVMEEQPGDNCDEDKVPNVALDLATITKTDLEIQFERTKKVIECDDEDI